MRKIKYNEKKYNAAIMTIAKQTIAMAQEDATPDEDEEDFWFRCEEYAADALQDITAAFDEIVEGQ